MFFIMNLKCFVTSLARIHKTELILLFGVKIMTMMEKIQNMNIDELALFISNVREGLLEDEFNLSCCTGKHFIDFNGEAKYDVVEFLKDYLSSPID